MIASVEDGSDLSPERHPDPSVVGGHIAADAIGCINRDGSGVNDQLESRSDENNNINNNNNNDHNNENNNDNESESEAEEEAMYVYVDFPELDGHDIFNSAQTKTVRFRGLFGEEPVCEIDNMIFRGSHATAIGTNLILNTGHNSESGIVGIFNRTIDFRLKGLISAPATDGGHRQTGLGKRNGSGLNEQKAKARRLIVNDFKIRDAVIVGDRADKGSKYLGCIGFISMTPVMYSSSGYKVTFGDDSECVFKSASQLTLIQGEIISAQCSTCMKRAFILSDWWPDRNEVWSCPMNPHFDESVHECVFRADCDSSIDGSPRSISSQSSIVSPIDLLFAELKEQANVIVDECVQKPHLVGMLGTIIKAPKIPRAIWYTVLFGDNSTANFRRPSLKLVHENVEKVECSVCRRNSFALANWLGDGSAWVCSMNPKYDASLHKCGLEIEPIEVDCVVEESNNNSNRSDYGDSIVSYNDNGSSNYDDNENETNSSNSINGEPVSSTTASVEIHRQTALSDSKELDFEAAFQILVPKNVLRGKEAEFDELIDEIGIERADEMRHVSKASLIRLSNLLKEVKRNQFLGACLLPLAN